MHAKAAVATAAALMLLACAGPAAARPLATLLGGGRLACQGVTPLAVHVGGLKAVGANGVIELSWQPVACASSYAVMVEREDIPPQQDNELSFNVTVTRAVVKNVANGSPYIVQIVACNGALCGPKIALRVTPSGSVPATMPTLPAGTTVPTAPAAAPGAVVGTMPTPSGYGAMLPGSQWRVVMRPVQA
ncbi:hypothetical protein ABPG77_002036 [Micractinium sp. CCAP 211/92]